MSGILRFCYECKHRIIVDGLPTGEFRCERHPKTKIFDSTEADQCIDTEDFEEMCISIWNLLVKDKIVYGLYSVYDFIICE